ncbi:hypothetical protein D9757_010517 [Collybiopsis confluens]|uniref:Tubulin nucleotide-binding domain-like protein n=1 Tax=Collybiopsis confluens TaxID=2823264 RepID=A0A8H5GNE7_9AGAR|nr:hypothetical protein D9757_010517 [Collybiopsis confluens]
MREILYVQAGNSANYIGTHFWNTQESYFTYSDDEDPIVDHDVSFREGQTIQGDPMYCPRLIAFDHKVNFGALAKANNFFSDSVSYAPLWNQSITEHEQEPIEPHVYQTHLQAEGDLPFSTDASTIRYWSDFNRVFYTPRTIQMVPDVSGWRNSEGDWSLGHETFERFNDETQLMEGSVRLFLEECNSFQGLQLTADTTTFGSFSHSFLLAFHDELSTAPCLSFPLMADAVPSDVNIEDVEPIIFSLNLHTHPLLRTENSCKKDCQRCRIPSRTGQYFSYERPSTKSEKVAQKSFRRVSKARSDRAKSQGSIYQDSSVLSAHIENSSVPLRLKGHTENIPSFCSHLNVHGSQRFSQIGGFFPVAASIKPQDFVNQFYDFSASRQSLIDATFYTRRDVTRGFSSNALHAYDEWCSRTPIKEPYAVSTHSLGYPLPSSFPDIFQDENILHDYRKRNTQITSDLPLPSLAMCTTLSTSTGTASMLADYAKFIQTCVDRGKTGILAGKIESMDDMKELVNDLWTIHDGYSEYTDD